MKSFLTIMLYLPALISLLGGTYISLRSRKSSTIWTLLLLAYATVIYYIFDAQIISPYANIHMLLIANLITPFIFPLVLAFLICFLWQVYYERPIGWIQTLWFVAPICLSTVSMILYIMIKPEDAIFFQQLVDRFRSFPEQFQHRPVFRMSYFMHNTCYVIVSTIYAIWIIIFAIRVLNKSGYNRFAFYSFLFKKATFPPMHLLMLAFLVLLLNVIFRSIFGRYFLIDHPYVNIMFAILRSISLIMIILSTLNLDYVECTLRQALRIDPNEDLEAEQNAMDDMDNAIDETDDAAIDNEAFRQVQERIDSNLQEIMKKDKLFLNCDIRMSEVARQLGTNRNYLSRHINEKYGVNFSEYINRMRIEFSKEFMLKNPNLLLDNIAIECGFNTAQSFGRRFKAIEGVSPRSWLASKKTP